MRSYLFNLVVLVINIALFFNIAYMEREIKQKMILLDTIISVACTPDENSYIKAFLDDDGKYTCHKFEERSYGQPPKYLEY